MTQLFEKTGTSLVFAMPPAARLQLGQVAGHTNQTVTVQGKNLFDKSKVEQGTADQNVGESYAANKTSSATRLRTTNIIKINGSVVFSWDSNTYDMLFRFFDVNGNYLSGTDWITVSPYVSSEQIYIAILFRHKDNSDILPSEFANSTAQLESGSTVTTYEPFIPNSPSPDYPAPMHGVNYVQKAGDKNLFKPATGTITANGVTCTVDADGTITLDGTATASINFELNPLHIGLTTVQSPIIIMTSGLVYTLSKTVVSGSTDGTINIILWDTLGKKYPTNYIYGGSGRTFTAGTAVGTNMSTELNIGDIALNILAGATYSQYKFRLQFEQSDVVTAWEESKGVNIYALPQTLYSLPDGTADVHNLISGSGIQKVGKVVLNGNETWSIQSTNYITVARFDGTVLSNAALINANKIICDKFTSLYGNDTDIEHIRNSTTAVPNNIVVYVLKSRLTGWTDSWTYAQKIAAFKTWLSSNPVIVLYELATTQTITGTAVGPITLPAGQVNVTTDGDGTVSLSVYNEWTDPKTDWNADDYFNLDPDYVRIKENIEYIKEFSEAMYDEFSIAEMGDFTIDGFPFDTFLNNIVDNVTALEENLFKPPQDGDMDRYVGGSPGWDYRQLNIIEGNIQRLHDAMVGQWNLLPTMAFSMGTGVDEF